MSRKRLLGLFLSVTLIVSAVPGVAFASNVVRDANGQERMSEKDELIDELPSVEVSAPEEEAEQTSYTESEIAKDGNKSLIETDKAGTDEEDIIEKAALATNISSYVTIDDDGIITAYSGTDIADILIPSVVDGKTVIGIGDRVFKGHTEIESVQFPLTLERIGNEAFRGVTFGKLNPTVTYSDLVIPASVNTIGYGAFKECSNLGTVEFKNYQGTGTPSAITFKNGGLGTDSYNTNQAFYACTNLTSIKLSNRTQDLPAGFASNSKKLQTVEWSGELQTIGGNAFDGDTALISSDFSGTKLTSIADRAFYECSNLEAARFPDTLETIGNEAFRKSLMGTSSPTVSYGDVIIPASVNTIGYGAFKECSNLGTVEFKNYQGTSTPSAVTFKNGGLGTDSYRTNQAFYACTNLISIKLSNRTQDLPAGFAQNDARLVYISIADNISGIASGAFSVAELTDTVLVTNSSVAKEYDWTADKRKLVDSTVARIVLDATSITLNPGEQRSLTASVIMVPEDAAKPSLKWESTNTKVATVKNGTIKAVSEGEAIINVSTTEGNCITPCTVTVTSGTVASFTVKFDTQGGNSIPDASVKEGSKVIKPANPVKGGFVFSGWYTDSLCTRVYDFNQPIHDNLILYAKWVESSSIPSSGMNPEADLTVNNELYLVKGQTFKISGTGWNIQGSSKAVSLSKKNGSTIVTAKKATSSAVEISNGTDTYKVFVSVPYATVNDGKSVKLVIGKSAVLRIAGIPDGQLDYYPVAWVSAKPEVATVEPSSGSTSTVTAVGKGSVTITAYVGGKPYKCKVTVTDDAKSIPKTIGVSENLTLNPMQTVSLKYSSFNAKNAQWKNVDSTSMNEIGGNPALLSNGIVKIERKTGKITAVGAGETTIIGTDASEKTVTLHITVLPLATNPVVYVKCGKTATLKAPKLKSNKAIWKNVSGEEYVQSLSNGKVKAVSTLPVSPLSDYAVISAVYKPYEFGNGFEYTWRVYVEDPSLKTSSDLTETKKGQYKLNLKSGDVFSLKDQYVGICRGVTWKNSKPPVAYIDENGLIHTSKEGNTGKTNLSTTVNGVKLKVTVTVSE